MRTPHPLLSVQIWDQNAIVDGLTDTRKGTKVKWTVSTDTEENYKANIANGKDPLLTFKPGEIDYSYNSHGYRSDEFKRYGEILYAGCSFTEGEGLPQDLIWTSQLNKLIEKEFDMELGYYNIGRGGLGVGGITRRIYGAFEVLKLKPKVLCVLMPSIFRQEVYPENFVKALAPTDYIPSVPTPSGSPAIRDFFKHYTQTFRLSNLINDFYKNLLFINALCKAHGTYLRVATWQGRVPIAELESDDLRWMPTEYNIDGHVDLAKLIFDYMPESLDINIFEESFGYGLQDYQKYPQKCGRDFCHPGPNNHLAFANRFFQWNTEDLKLFLQR